MIGGPAYCESAGAAWSLVVPKLLTKGGAMGRRLLGPSKWVLSVSGISPSVMSAIAEGSKVGPNTAMRTTVDDGGRLVVDRDTDFVVVVVVVCSGSIGQ